MAFIWLLFQPLPQTLKIVTQLNLWIAHEIANILNIPAVFVFRKVFDLINEMQLLFGTKTVLSYLRMDHNLKIYVHET